MSPPEALQNDRAGCLNGHLAQFLNERQVCSKCAAAYAYRSRRHDRAGSNTAKASPDHASNP